MVSFEENSAGIPAGFYDASEGVQGLDSLAFCRWYLEEMNFVLRSQEFAKGC